MTERSIVSSKADILTKKLDPFDFKNPIEDSLSCAKYPLCQQGSSSNLNITSGNPSNFFKSVGDMLPCKYCRSSYQIYYKYLQIDPFLDSREGVCYWLYRLHQLVNEKIFKENATLENVI